MVRFDSFPAKAFIKGVEVVVLCEHDTMPDHYVFRDKSWLSLAPATEFTLTPPKVYDVRFIARVVNGKVNVSVIDTALPDGVNAFLSFEQKFFNGEGT